MKRAWHIARKVIAGLGFLVILVIGGAIAFAHTDYARDRLREEVSTKLRTDYGLEASFEDLEIDLLGPRVHILGTRIEGSDDLPLATITRVTIGLSPVALLRGEVEINELTLEEPDLRLIVDGTKILNLPVLRRPTPTKSDDGGGSQPIHDLGVVSGHVSLELRNVVPGGPLEINLEDTNVDVSFDEEGNPAARLLIGGGEISHGGFDHAVEVIQGRVMVRDDQAELRQLRLSVGDLRLSVPTATIGTRAPFDAQGTGEVWLPLELVRQLPLPAPPLTGETHVAFEVSREEGRLEAQGRLELEGLIIGPERTGPSTTRGPHAIGAVTTNFHYTPEALQLTGLEIDRPVEGDGVLALSTLSIDLSDPSYPIRGEVEFRDVQLAQILIDAGLYASKVRLRIFGETTMVGHLGGGFELNFHPLELRTRDFEVLTASINKPDGERVLAFPVATLRGTAFIDRTGVALRNLAIGIGQTSLGVNGHLGFSDPTRRMLLHVVSRQNGFRFQDIGGNIAGLDFRGQGSLRADIEGPYGDPTIQGRVDFDDFGLASIELGRIRGNVHYRDLILSLPQITGQRNQSRYQLADGRVTFQGGIRFGSVASFAPMQLEEAVSMFGLEGQFLRARGNAEGQAAIRYTSRGNRWEVDVETALAQTAFAGVELGDGSVRLRYDRGDIALEGLELAREGASARASGQIGRGGELDLEVAVAGLPLSQIEQLPAPFDELEGTARATARIRGTTALPTALGWLDLSPVVFRGTRFGPSRVHFDLDGYELTLQGGLAGRLFQLEEARLTLSPPYPLWVRGTIRGLEVADLLGPDTLPRDMGVWLNATIDAGLEVGRLSQTPSSPRATPNYGLSGWATIDALTVVYPAFTIQNVEPVRLELRRDRAAIDRGIFTFHSTTLAEATRFELGGWASLQTMGLELRTRELDLGFVPDVIDSVSELAGRLDLDCQIGGTYSEPTLLGSAALRIDRLAIAGLESYAAEQMTGSIRFSRNAVLIEDVRARLMGGRLNGGGRVTLQGVGLGSYRLDAMVQDARLNLGPRSSAVLNGTVNLTNPPTEEELPTVGGQLEVVRLRYTEPIELFGDVDQLTRRRRTEVNTYDSASDSIRLDLQLTGERNLRIENNLAEAEIVLDDRTQPFRLVGTNQVQSFLGSMQVVRHGTITFRDTEFDIDRGLLVFDDPFEFNPQMDFLATARRRDWVITLQIYGTADDPTLVLTSDPPLSEEDIALLLTVGLTREETEQLGYGSAAQTALPELLWSLTGVDDELSRLVPMIDELRITTDYSRRTGRAEPRVRVAQRLTPNVRIGASAGLSDSRDFEATLEVEWTDNLSFEVGYENDTDFDLGNIGGDLRWRMEF